MKPFVQPLKSFGQHFLTDKNVLENIILAIQKFHTNEPIIEIGPGTGALTDYLFPVFKNLTCIEVDKRCIGFLNTKYNASSTALKIIDADFLKLPIDDFATEQTGIVGNFPYNISSQIVFKILDNFEKIPFMVGMFQKEMGHRIASKNVSKEYGVISVLAQLYYDIEVEFDIFPNSFSPPPKVMSSIISMKRKEKILIDFDYKLFKTIVKAGFSQRRKMLRSGLSGIAPKAILQQEIFNKRAEQLSVQDFIDLTKMITLENGK